MAIITFRTREKGKITFDHDRCTSCGLCVKICKDLSLKMEGERPVLSGSPLFGCIGCGHCMAICPANAITVSGREISADDLIDMPLETGFPDYEQLKNLMVARRSIRDFRDKEVPAGIVEKIIQAAVSAPMGLPPSDVYLVVFEGKKKVRAFSFDVIDHIKKNRWVFSKHWIWLWRLFGKETYEVMKSFGLPMANFFVDEKEKGNNWLLYDAPLAMYFQSSPYADPVDPVIPATYAMLAAETLGLGSCMIGSVQPFIRYGAKPLKKKWKLLANAPAGIIVVFGYPKYQFKHALKRTFGQIVVHGNEQA